MTYTENIKDALIAKNNAEFKRLEQKGFCMSGNGFAQIIALTSIASAKQGAPSQDALKQGMPQQDAPNQVAPLLSPTAQDALEKAFVSLGYPPHCWAVVALPCPAQKTRAADETLHKALREVCAVFSAHTVLLCTNEATEAMRAAYATELTTLANIDIALLAPGTLASVCGMRVLNVGDLEGTFATEAKKQRLWSWLKQLRP